MNRILSRLGGLFVLVAVPLFFSLAGIGDGVPSRARFEKVVTDPGLRESVAVVIRDERKLFEEMLQDSGYLDYGRHNERQKDEAVFSVSDSLGRSYELTRAHINYLRLIVFGSSFGDETKTIDAIRAMKPQRLDFNPHWFLYGGAYIYPCAASIAAFLLPAFATGELSSSPLGDITVFIRNADLLSRIFLGMKFVNALAFVFSTCMLYLLARRLVRDSHGAGLFAAVLWAPTLRPRLLPLHDGPGSDRGIRASEE